MKLLDFFICPYEEIVREEILKKFYPEERKLVISLWNERINSPWDVDEGRESLWREKQRMYSPRGEIHQSIQMLKCSQETRDAVFSFYKDIQSLLFDDEAEKYARFTD